MNKYLKNQKGLSLVELMTAVVIAGAIVGAVSGFLHMHMKSYESTQDIVDIQYEAQLALNQMAEMIMESTGVHDITNSDGAGATGNVSALTPNMISFKDVSGLEQVFTKGVIPADENTIFYQDSSLPSRVIFAQNVTSLSFRPLNGYSFEKCNALEITMVLKKGGADLTLTTQVKIRNKINTP